MPSNESILKIHPSDNVAVALTDLRKGETVKLNDTDYILVSDVPAKHKFMLTDFHRKERSLCTACSSVKPFIQFQKEG